MSGQSPLSNLAGLLKCLSLIFKRLTLKQAHVTTVDASLLQSKKQYDVYN